jgi:hypothetical protein
MTSVLSREEGRAAGEKAIHAAVIAHWRAFGVPGSLVATIPNARAFGQPGLCKGLFDLVVIAPDLPVGFIELKRLGGLISEEQGDFAALCHLRGIPCEVTFGRDEPIAVLEKWGAVRRMVRQ